MESGNPTLNRVIIDVIKEDSVTAGGIVMPETVKKDGNVGNVVAVGPGRYSADGTRIVPEVQVGDRVMFSPSYGEPIKIDGKDYVLLNDEAIIFVFSKR